MRHTATFIREHDDVKEVWLSLPLVRTSKSEKGTSETETSKDDSTVNSTVNCLNDVLDGNKLTDIQQSLLRQMIETPSIQKGHRIDEEIAQDLLKRDLIEGEAPNYTISLGVAKASKQLPGYIKVKGLERDKIKQMILQYIQNAGSDGAKRDAIMEYLEGTLPSRNTDEQNLRVIGNILKELSVSGAITTRNRLCILITTSKYEVMTKRRLLVVITTKNAL